MSDELGAVLESPELDVVDTVDVADDVVETPVEPVAEVVADAKEDTTDWRKVPAELKEFFKTPAGKAAKDAWFERNAYKEKFPEGIKQVNELTSFLDEHGGREGLVTALGELKGKADELDAISTKIQNADPSLVADLPPETVAKLGPVMDAQWRSADPEGWNAAMSGVMAATIAQNGVPMFLEKLDMLMEFGKLEDARKMVGDLKGWANSFGQKAQAPAKAETKQQPDKYKEREQELNQREEKIFFDDIRRDVDTSFRTPTITKELESFFKRRPLDNDAKDLAIREVRAGVAKRMEDDKEYQRSLTAFTSRKDRDGAIKLLKSREETAIKDIAAKVGRTIFGNPAPAKAEAKAPVAPTQIRPKADVDPRDAILQRAFGR